MKRISKSELLVTHGEIGETTPGHLVVENPSVRAVLSHGADRSAQLHFVYLGPTRKDAPLDSGEIRRQVALKLRAQNGCNLIYVAWRLEPKAGVVVSVKHNSDKTVHAECGAKGYQNISPEHSAPAPLVKPKTPHILAVRLNKTQLSVLADNSLVWEGALPSEVLEFDGPVGIRTDNGRFEIELQIGP